MSNNIRFTIDRKFKPNQEVILDKGFNNSSKVTVVTQTPRSFWTKVKDEDGESWEVMTYRLTPIS